MFALLLAGLAVGASAGALPRVEGCCFQLTASGGATGILGQLSDGQNRVGGACPAGTYCINNGAIIDSNSRGCILTPPTTQFQCDVGATPTSGFSIGSNGALQYNGNTRFYACPATTDNKEFNVYTTPVKDQAKCVEIALNTAGKCAAGGSSKPAPAPSASKPAPHVPAYIPATSVVKTTKVVPQVQPPAPAFTPALSKPAPSGTETSAPSCPIDISGPHQTPHLIVPVSKSTPDKAYGTQYNATITPDQCTIFNFDIPQDYSGKSCSIIFLFPQQKDLKTSAFTFSGSGEITFSELSSAASQTTTYNNCPAKKSDLGTKAVQPGNSYSISTGSCAAGQTVSIEACSSGGLSLEYFQDWNPSPIGTYITSC